MHFPWLKQREKQSGAGPLACLGSQSWLRVVAWRDMGLITKQSAQELEHVHCTVAQSEKPFKVSAGKQT